ncbi:hypothetical protein ACS3L2_002625 [Serratia marcescens]|nr:hypothetical protein [Serratia marcescens]
MTKSNKKTSDDDVGLNNVCGIIMPIANSASYPDGHWKDVLAILSEAAMEAGFEAKLVSFDEDVAVIQKRIVQNIYNNPIVICDISSRNANVMFELGMRLAFDKPTVIVKDEKTPYSFDISSIEHLDYPSDLRYQSINEFKERLKAKVYETYKRSQNDPEYTTFLKHFGTFKVAKLEEKEVGANELLLDEIRDFKKIISEQVNMVSRASRSTLFKDVNGNYKSYEYPLSVPGIASKLDEVEEAFKELSNKSGLEIPDYRLAGTNRIILKFNNSMPESGLEFYKKILSGI